MWILWYLPFEALTGALVVFLFNQAPIHPYFVLIVDVRLLKISPDEYFPLYMLETYYLLFIAYVPLQTVDALYVQRVVLIPWVH